MNSCFFIGHHDAPESIYPALLTQVERTHHRALNTKCTAPEGFPSGAVRYRHHSMMKL